MELFGFYNVENLFPADIKPVHKLDPTRSGLRNWNEMKYKNKLYKLAHVFQLIEEEEGVKPFLFGVSEISSRKVLEDLLSIAELQDFYGIVHYESLDERGVDVALFYDKNKVQILKSEPIRFVFEKNTMNGESMDTTRDVLYVTLQYQDMIVNVFVVHLPSQREAINAPKREHILYEIRSKITDIVESDNEAVIICGDFNEDPTDDNIRSFRKSDSGNSLLNQPFYDLFQQRIFSTYHKKQGLLFDQILFSDDFVKEGATLKFQNAKVFKSDKIADWNKKFKGRPFRTYAGTRYLGGYSDHFPVLVEFTNNKK